jgi:shikimate dehydrogenase
MDKLVALIGYPLKHSISPSFQQASFDYYQLDVSYKAWEIEPSYLGEAVSKLRQTSVLGANVTIPHKEMVVPLLDKVDEMALGIGAVNTIVNRNGKLTGYNTDAPAFIRTLRQDGGFEPGGKGAVLLGAGGVARAVSIALLREKVESLTITNRTMERAEKLAASLKQKFGSNARIMVLPWRELEINKPLINCDLIINCTSIGMKHGPTEHQTPLIAGVIPKDALVYDLVYNPIETPLLKEARKAGAYTLGGLSMLVYQGAASFEFWVGREAPIEIMFKKAKEALGYE